MHVVSASNSLLSPAQGKCAATELAPDQIPLSRAAWKAITDEEDTYDRAWMAVAPFFLTQGYELHIAYDRFARTLAPKCMVEDKDPDEFGMIGNFVFVPPFELFGAAYTWPATEVSTGHQVLIRAITHINDPPPPNDTTDLMSVYKYLLSVIPPDEPRNHIMLPFKFIEHMGWTFGVFPRWGDIQTGHRGFDMQEVGEEVDFLVQISEGLAYLHSLGIAHNLVHEDSFVRNIFGAEHAHPQWPIYRAFEPTTLPIRYGIVLHSIVRFVGTSAQLADEENLVHTDGKNTGMKGVPALPHKVNSCVHSNPKGKSREAASVNLYLARDVYLLGTMIRACMLPLFPHIPELDPFTLRMISEGREDRPTMEEVHQCFLNIQTSLTPEVKERECSMEFVTTWPEVNEEIEELHNYCCDSLNYVSPS